MSAVTASKSNIVMTAPQVETSTRFGTSGNEQGFGQVLRRELGRQVSESQDGKIVQEETSTTVENIEQTEAMPWLLMLQQLSLAEPSPDLAEEAVLQEDVLDGSDNLLDPADLLRLKLQQLAGAESGGGGAVRMNDVDSEPPEAQVLTSTQGLMARMQPANVSAEGGKDLPQQFGRDGSDSAFGELLLETQESLARPPHDLSLPGAAAQGVEQAKAVSQSVTVSRFTVDEPVGNARWGEVVAQRVTLMLGKQEQQMEMQLNPPNLGPMEVRLTLGADQASVVFASQHAAVREALAAATPRLTVLLADQGIQLVNVQVASESLQQHAQGQTQQQADLGGRGRDGLHDVRRDAERSPQLRGVENGLAMGVSLPVARSGVSLYI